MKSLKRQAGHGALLMLGMLSLLAIGSSVYYSTRMSQPASARETYESTAEEFRQLTGALSQYYKDNMSWPSTLNELSPYFTGDAARCGGSGTLQSPFCTVIFGSQVGDN